MEENVWSEPEVYSLLKEDYVLISLYIDDRKRLSDDDTFDFKFDSGRVKSISTVGEKWGTFQTLNFNSASQPYYVLLSPELELLNSAMQSADSDVYRDWLQKGLDSYNSLTERPIVGNQ